LLYVPSHPARDLDEDLEQAGIPKRTPEGKLDFHSARVAYVSWILEGGASPKEAQELARHSTAALTMNVYARARSGRLAEVTEAVGQTVRGLSTTEAQSKNGHGVKPIVADSSVIVASGSTPAASTIRLARYARSLMARPLIRASRMP